MKNHLQQLKYGNFVRGIHLDAEYYSVIEIGAERIVLQNPINNKFVTVLKEYFYRIEEVELDEKWLLKFGFKKVEFDSEETGYGIEYHLNIEGVGYLIYCDDFSLALFGSDKEKDRLSLGVLPNWDKVKFVHGFQNLYFSLTGEEIL